MEVRLNFRLCQHMSHTFGLWCWREMGDDNRCMKHSRGPRHPVGKCR